MCEASMILDEKNKLKQITELLQQLSLAGLQREYEVCTAVQRVHMTDLKFCSAWNTCNLTGEMCADSLHFLCDGVSYNIHKRFAYFAYCLWTCTHMPKLRQELAREMIESQTAVPQGSESAEALEASDAPEAPQAPQAPEAPQAPQASEAPQAHTPATLHTGFNVAYDYVCDVLRGTLVDFI